MSPVCLTRRLGLLCVAVVVGVAVSACAPSNAPSACFTVTLPAGWTSEVTDRCGLVLSGPQGASGTITVDTEPVDAAEVKALIGQKFSDADVAVQTVEGDQVLIGTGSVPGAMYILVQARSASSGRNGYYAQVLTPQPSQLAEIKTILASLRATT